MDSDDTSTDEEAIGHELVAPTSSVQILCQRPGRCIGVVGLDGGAAPGIIAVAVHKKISVAVYNGDHDCIVDETTQNRPVDLGREHHSRRDLDCGVG